MITDFSVCSPPQSEGPVVLCFSVQGVTVHGGSVVPVQCLSFMDVFKKEGSERGNQTRFNCLLEKSLDSQAMSLKAKGLLRL